MCRAWQGKNNRAYSVSQSSIQHQRDRTCAKMECRASQASNIKSPTMCKDGVSSQSSIQHQHDQTCAIIECRASQASNINMTKHVQRWSVTPTLALPEQILEQSTEAPSAKTLAVLRDPSKGKRGAQYLSWHPDGSRKVYPLLAIVRALGHRSEAAMVGCRQCMAAIASRCHIHILCLMAA